MGVNMLKIFLKNIKLIYKITPILVTIKIFLCIIDSLMISINLFFTKKTIESIQEFINYDAKISTILFYVFLLILVMGLSIINGFIGNIINLKIQRKINIVISDKVIDKYKKIKYSHYENSNTQNIIKNISKSPDEKIFNVFVNSIEIISKIITILSLCVLFFQVSYYLTLIYLFVVTLITYFDFKTMNEMNQMFNNQTQNERFMDYLDSVLSDKNALYELKIYNTLDYIKRKWNLISKIVLEEKKCTTFKTRRYYLISSSLIFLWIFAVYVILSYYLIVFGYTFLALFITLIGAANTIFENTESLSYRLSMLSQNAYVIKNYDEFMSLSEIEKFDFNTGNFDLENLKIEFKNVYFKYPNSDDYVLENLNFIMNGKEKIAIVGKNGAGKSTIVKLLCKLYSPTRGEIHINNVNLDNISYTLLSKIFSGVFQNYVEYALTLRENVAISNISNLLNDTCILKCLKESNFDEDILLDQKLGRLENMDIELSKGQWQKIAVSRAYFSDSKIMILDEPTSSLDPIAENSVYKSFQKVIGSKGCIIISHRLGSAKVADRIIVLENGKIVEDGTHSELINKNSIYANMFKTQKSWYITESDECE